MRRPLGFLAASLVALATAEVALRLVLFSGRAPLGVVTHLAGLLGSEYDDELHRLLLHVKFAGPQPQPPFATFDPQLGWTARPRTPENPLGILRDEPYSLDEARRWKAVLFFGDSFTAGLGRRTASIPDQLGRLVPERTVVNLGVPGYGLDQIYLLLRAVIDRFDHPQVIVGIFYNDLDRVVFQVQASVKPWFTVENGRLVEHGTPIPADASVWIGRHRPRTWLYAVHAVRGVADELFVSPWMTERYFWLHPSETTRRRSEKQELTRLLVRAIKDECDRRHLDLTVVLFPYREHLLHDGWYESFMRELLRREGIEFLDLEGPLRRRIAALGMHWTDVYGTFAHPTAAENAFIAAEIAAFLRRGGRPGGHSTGGSP